MHEERCDLDMKVVPRREDSAKRKVIEIREIDLMTGFHLAQELRREHQAEEDVDRQHVNEIRAVNSKRFFTIGLPITDDVFRGLRYAKKLKPKP